MEESSKTEEIVRSSDKPLLGSGSDSLKHSDHPLYPNAKKVYLAGTIFMVNLNLLSPAPSQSYSISI
jgi:hypothetical protein